MTTGGRPAADPSVSVLEQLPVGVALLDASGAVVWVNRALLDLLGRRADGVTAGGWSAPGADLAVDWSTVLVGVDAGEAGPRRVHLHHADGRRLVVRVRTGRVDPADPGAGSFVVLDDVTVEHDLAERLADQAAKTEDRLRQVFDASPDAFAVYRVVRDAAGQVTSLLLGMLNAAGLADTGWAPEDVLGMDVRHVIPQAEDSGFLASMHAVLAGAPPHLGRYTFTRDGRTRVLEGRSVLLDDDTLLVTWRDVTDIVDGERLLERAYEETAEMRATLQTALDATSDCFAVYALEWEERPGARVLTGLRVLHVNAAASERLGREPEDMIGMELHEFFPDVDRSGLWDRIVVAAVTKAPTQYRVHRFDAAGEWTASWDNTVAPVGEERMAITWRDVSAEERAFRQLAQHRDEAMHSATHDALTGLPNRVLLRDHLAGALRACPEHQRVGIVFVDLDRFKAINDTYGHAAGDAVLCATARRLTYVVRQGDLAARLAGDEFVLVLTGLPTDWTPDRFFARATALLTEPVQAEDVELRPEASLGAVIWAPHTGPADVDLLIKSADAAMYQAKAARRAAR
jgi:diguanylate cyclase (GGDEF)-like protein/PAS domain S-box-containing protein